MSTKAKWINGVLCYYDTATQEIVLPVAPFHFYEDFEGVTLVAGATRWVAKDTHADATEANIADKHGGVFGMGLGATDAEQEAGLTMNNQHNINLDKSPVIEYVAALHTLPTLLAEIYFGIGNDYVKGTLAAADQGPTVHAAFMFDGSGACTIHTDDASTDNDAVATGITVLADVYHVFRIDFTVITDVKFYIDGARVAAATTFTMANGSNVMVQPYMMVYKSAGAGLGDLYVDSVRAWSGR